MPGLHLSLQLPQFFNPKLVLNQLRYSGMLETVRIRRAGYPVRRTYEDFLFRYKVIVKVIALREGCLYWPLSKRWFLCYVIPRYMTSCLDLTHVMSVHVRSCNVTQKFLLRNLSCIRRV